MFSMVKDPCFTILVSHMKECGLMADLKVKILKSCETFNSRGDKDVASLYNIYTLSCKQVMRICKLIR